jgi:hypothetical protein
VTFGIIWMQNHCHPLGIGVELLMVQAVVLVYATHVVAKPLGTLMVSFAVPVPMLNVLVPVPA